MPAPPASRLSAPTADHLSAPPPASFPSAAARATPASNLLQPIPASAATATLQPPQHHIGRASPLPPLLVSPRSPSLRAAPRLLDCPSLGSHLASYADGLLECTWHPADGRHATSAKLARRHLPAWLVDSTTLPVCITFRFDPGPGWRPHSVVCESVACREAGLPTQLGYYLLLPAAKDDVIDSLDGRRLGRFRPGSAAYLRAVAQVLDHPCAHHSYLFTIRESGGYETLWDGAHGRFGGLRAANDPRGIRPRGGPNASLGDLEDPSEDHVLRATKPIAAVGPSDTPERMCAKEVLWSYGPAFWAARA